MDMESGRGTMERGRGNIKRGSGDGDKEK